MTRERKLKLVGPIVSSERGEPRSEIDVRDVGDPELDDLELALRAAWGKGAELDDTDHEAILSRALGAGGEGTKGRSADAAPTRLERTEAEAVRRALGANLGEVGEGARAQASPDARELAELALVLRSAARPRALDHAANAALVERALSNLNRPLEEESAPRASSDGSGAPTRIEVRRRAPAFAAISALALAAAALLVFRTPATDGARQAELRAPASLVRSRSAAELFDANTPFPRLGGHADRVDRIAGARLSELRRNRYARWGVE